jgi:hypothetical protein
MLLRHYFGLLALNLLLQARKALSDKGDFELEFRLMIISDQPDTMMVTVQDQYGGGESDGKADDLDNQSWKSGVDARKDDGGSRLSYMAWSRPHPEPRTTWYHKKEDAKDAPGSQKASVC